VSLNNENVKLTPGEYIVVVDAIWHASASQDTLHKNVLVDIYCQDRIEIEPIDDNAGMIALATMLKNFAQNMTGDDVRKYYLRNKFPAFANVYRVENPYSTGSWYGFYYTRNDSAKNLYETFTPKLKGGEVVWPINSGANIEQKMGPGKDRIVVIRRTENAASFGYSYSTAPPK
jgi:hypothetical protein